MARALLTGVCVVMMPVVGYGAKEQAKEDPNLAAKEKKVRSDVKIIEQALNVYKVNTGDYPESLKDLTKPQKNGARAILDPKSIKDPWGKLYQFDAAGPRHDGKTPDVWTVSPEGRRIGNWQENK